jgi:DUF4097 and DUF4098 domain-containing protein YvlB
MNRFVLGGLLAATLAPAMLAAQREVPFSWSGALAAGKTLEIRGVNGNIEASGTGGREATVKAVKRGKKSDPSSVEIRVIEGAEGVTLCAVYPSQSGSTGCKGEGKGGTWEENDVSVHFTVQVPEGVRLEAATVNGSVHARGLTADAEVTAVNGDVSLATTGVGEATTVNGSVRLDLGKATWDGEIEAKTVNGSIVVHMPEPKHLSIEASMLNGDFESDFPLTLSGKISRREVKGKVGDGGPMLELSTVNGGIELRKAQ